MLTLTAMAAGFGGLFQTPLAATFFALEVITPGRLRLEALAPAPSAAFSACLCSGFLGLHHSVFTFDAAFSLRLSLLGKAALLGILFGLCGLAFSASLAFMKRKMAAWMPDPRVRILPCGALISFLILLLHQGALCWRAPLIDMSQGAGEIFWYDWLLKGALTVLTLSAGFQGGEVTPLFSIGASLGAVLAPAFGLSAASGAALGYASVFASASNTLIAPILIGAEVFGLQALPFFVVSVAFSGSGVFIPNALFSHGRSNYPQRGY